MKILYCNKYNFPFSGTESYLFEAMKLVRMRGHETALFSMADSRGEPTPLDRFFVPNIDFKLKGGWLCKAKLAARAIYSHDARRRLRALLAEFRPDVAHVRNIYHHLSPSILWELKAQSIPVIYHLNDFKVLCPSYNLVSRGKSCEACKGGRFWRAIPENCYPGFAERVTLVAEAYVHKAIGTYRKCVDRFLAPSQFVMDKFVEHGWDPGKFEVLSHFQPLTNVNRRLDEAGTILYFGRLSREKGIDDLLHAMSRLPHLRLTIAGDGPDRHRLEQITAELQMSNVQYVGHLRKDELERLIQNSCFTVLPSHAYETFGKTILESYAHGRTVVASDLGSRRELIEDGKTGLLYKTGDIGQLTSALNFLSSRPDLADEWGRTGQLRVRERYTPESHYAALIDLYERMSNKKKASSAWEKQKLTVKQQEVLRIPPSEPRPQVVPPSIRVAFIGGRGVCSKYSGIETYYEEVGQRLVAMGYEVTAYCRNYFTPAIERHRGIKVLRLPTIRSKHLETLLHTFLSTLHVLKEPCDVVHYHALGPALFSFIPRLAGKKTVVSVQGLDWQRKKWGRIAAKILQLGEQAAVSLPNATIVVSRTLQNYYRNRHRAETYYVPNGGLLRSKVAPAKIADWGLEAQNYILFLGRFSPEKGCHLLVEAYERLNTPVKLVMAGATSYCDDYSRQLQSHASGQIQMLDWVSGAELDELLTNAMIFVLPSDLEGLSLALLDAMGAGLCVLTSDVPENREAMEGVGFTFRRGDAHDLSMRLQFLISNPTVRQAAGEAARRRMQEEYRWSEVAAGVAEVYKNILGIRAAEVIGKKPSGRVTEAPAESTRRKVG